MDNPPNTNIHTIVRAQIVFLLSTLTEENFERNQIEIRSLSEQHGIETYLHFIRRLIHQSQSRLAPGAPSTAFDASINLTFRLLVQETQRLARDPFLADRFRDGVDRGEGDTFRSFDLIRFMDRIGLRPLEKFVLAAPFVSTSLSRKELATQANAIIRHDFDNAVLALCHNPSFDHADLSPSQVSKLMNNLLSDPPIDSPVLDATQRQALIVSAQTKYGNDTVAPILQRILPSLSLPAGTSVVQALVQLGPDITSDPDVVRAILLRFGLSDSQPPESAQVVDAIATLARLTSEGNVICDAGALIRAFVSMRAKIEWTNIIKIFDQPDRHGVDTATLKLLIAILHNCPRDAEPHAVTGFWGAWNNPLQQLRLLDALLSLPADTFNFVQLPGRRIVTVEDVSVASPTIKSLAANVQGHTWNSLDLFEVLVRLTSSESMEVRSCVRDMLDKAIKISAELVHLGLLQATDPTWNEIRLEYSRRLLSMFLAGHPNHQLVFMRIWQIEPSYLTNAFREFYEENHSNITRISDVAQDLKILEALLEVRPFTFALDIASLASRREYLNLDKWLADKVQSSGSEFLHAIIVFLEQKMSAEKQLRLLVSDPPSDTRSLALSPSTVTIFLRILRNSANLIEQEDVNYCIEVRNLCLQIHPRLLNLVPGTESEPGLSVVSYTADIEAEVDAIYKAMYDEQTRIEDVISILKRNKASPSQRDREVFSCMLHFLFDEYKFFQTYYPIRELLMTGILYGALVQFDLVDFLTLGIVLRYIIDALHCPPETNLFRFGLKAMERFESRLPEWRPVCQELLAIPHLMEIRQDLAAALPRILATAEVAQPDGRDLDSIAEPHPVFTSIRPDLMDEDIDEPPEETSDKILFIINNLAPSNFDSKLEEMREHFVDDYARWFSNYLVHQRVSTEPNNHQLYLRFLDALNHKNVFSLVLQETFVKSANLLNAESTMQSSTERSVLKNVAIWLGNITLARDKPIRHKNVSFKDLLLEGFENGRLIVAIPFVCKTLEGCSKSKVFRPPNPWLMAVLSLLAELYHFADLKLNAKFEIEMLCKALDVKLDTIEPTTILRSRPLNGALAGPTLPDYVGDLDPLSMGPFDSAGQMIGEPQILALGATDADAQRAIASHIESILAALASHVYINPSLAPLSSNAAFKRIVQVAIDRAVRDIISPVVERSVTISSISTRELVLKDFATEANEERMRKAGHLMAQKLAGSLALVTCKEPLRASLATHLKQYMVENGYYEDESQANLLDAVVATLVQDNLDTACKAIERGAMERAVKEIDEAFHQSYLVRRRHREVSGMGQFWDPHAPEPTFTTSLPPALRVHPHGLQQLQLHVYEDFGNGEPKGRPLASRPASTMSFSRNEFIGGQVAYPPSPAPNPNSGAQYLNHQESMERFNAIMRELDGQLMQMPNTPSLAALPPNHEVRHLVRQALFTTLEASDRQRTPLQMAQKIVQLLYKATSQIAREVYVAVLDQICHSFEDVGKEVVNWLLYAEDERKFNVPVTATLLRSGLINTTLQDQQLASTLYTDPRPSLQNFLAGLIRECLTATPPIADRTQFAHSLETLAQLAQSDKSTEDVNLLLEDLHIVRRSAPEPTPSAIARPSPPENEQLREKLYFWFQQWVTIFQRSHSPEKSFIPFITQLNKQGVLKVDNMASSFFRVCAESSVISYLNCIQAGDFAFAFQALDATARLIVYIVKYHGGDASETNLPGAKAYYFKKILSIFVLVLSNMHEEEGTAFPQKPFFRFFSSLINDLHTMETQLGPAYPSLLIGLSDTLNLVQPTYFPGFSFSWMCLISHRFFMPKLLLSDNREGWSAFHQHCISLFRFLAPFLKNSNLQHAVKDLYRGTLRILLVLLHDFPEFLSEYYFSLCDVIPPRCLQLRNVILSAFPPSVTLTDPYLPRPTDTNHETGPIPFILSDFSAILKQGDLRVYLDQYLLGRGTPSFLPSLKAELKVATPDGGEETYNLSRINAIVMYIGVSSVAQAKARSGSTLFVPTDHGVVALQYLATNLDVEGQHHLLTSMATHLRYPNAHTHWFISLFLHLFLEIKDDVFREVVTKVLLEKFVVHRPHPWGALVTFIELLRNPKFDFWSKEFVHIAPEVTLLLENVAKSIFPQH